MVDNNSYNNQYSHPAAPMQGSYAENNNENRPTTVSSGEFKHFFDKRDELRKQAKKLNKQKNSAQRFIVISIFFTLGLFILFPLVIFACIRYSTIKKEFNSVKEQLQQLGEIYKEEYRRFCTSSNHHHGDGFPSRDRNDEFDLDDCGDYGGWDDGGYDGGGNYSDGGSGCYDGGDGDGGDGGGGGGDGGGDGD